MLAGHGPGVNTYYLDYGLRGDDGYLIETGNSLDVGCAVRTGGYIQQRLVRTAHPTMFL